MEQTTEGLIKKLTELQIETKRCSWSLGYVRNEECYVIHIVNSNQSFYDVDIQQVLIKAIKWIETNRKETMKIRYTL